MVTEYSLPLDDAYASTLGRAVRHAVGTFIDRVEDPGTPMTAIVAEFREIGFAAAREGHNLEPLQAAMRLSARVGWRRLCRMAGEQGLDMLMLGHIGEAILVYLDELAAASARGYLDARSELADERDRRRRKLLDMILAEPPAAADAIAGIAKAAGWALPPRIAVIALGDRPPGDAAAVPALPPGALIDWGRREPCVLVPDPDGPGRLSRIEQAMLGWEAAMGPVVPLARANMSLRWARAALGLAARGVIGGHGRRRADRRQRRPAPPSRCLRQRSHPSCRRRGPLNPLLEPPMLIVRRLSLERPMLLLGRLLRWVTFRAPNVLGADRPPR